MIIKKQNRKDGYISLISVLVIGSVGVAITLSLLRLGLGLSRTSFTYQQSNQAKALANACAEEGLEKIRNSDLFTGNGNLSISAGSCAYTVTSQGGQNRTVVAVGNIGNIVRKVSVVIDGIYPLLSVVSWQEIQ